jgi:hypothetical protein
LAKRERDNKTSRDPSSSREEENTSLLNAPLPVKDKTTKQHNTLCAVGYQSAKGIINKNSPSFFASKCPRQTLVAAIPFRSKAIADIP